MDKSLIEIYTDRIKIMQYIIFNKDPFISGRKKMYQKCHVPFMLIKEDSG